MFCCEIAKKCNNEHPWILIVICSSVGGESDSNKESEEVDNHTQSEEETVSLPCQQESESLSNKAAANVRCDGKITDQSNIFVSETRVWPMTKLYVFTFP